MIAHKFVDSQIMINSTPISVSDCSEVIGLKALDSSEGTVKHSLPYSSSIGEPISWKSQKFKQSLSHLKTPSGIDRVVDWMGNNIVPTTTPEGVIKEKTNEDNTKFFRYDYKVIKSPTKKTIFTKGFPLWISSIDLDNNLKHKSTKEISIENIRNECRSECSLSLNINENLDERNRVQQLQNSGIYISPSSAESRKKELCNYLKLMNHADKKEVSLSQYRRSTRVKNLEQKELARKINHKSKRSSCDSTLDGYSDKSNKTSQDKLSDIGESITLQSFNDLNMTIDTSKYLTLQENEDKKVFNFIMPPNNVLNEFNDFQFGIEPIIKEAKGLDKNQIKSRMGDSSFTDSNTSDDIETEEDSRGNLKSNISIRKSMSNENNQLRKYRKKYRDKAINLDWTSSHINKRIDFKKDNHNSQKIIDLKETSDIIDEQYKDINKTLIENGSAVSVKSIVEEVSGIDVKIDKYGYKRKRNGSIIENNVNSIIDCNSIVLSQENDRIPSSNRDDLLKCEYSSNIDELMPHCLGFNEYDLKKSLEIDFKFKEYLEILCSLAKNIPAKSTIIFNDICIENVDENFEKTYETWAERCTSEEEMKENQSDSDSASDSLSSVESNDSSQSNSCSPSEQENTNDGFIQKCDIISPSQISPRIKELLPFNDSVEIQSLHSLLKKQVKTASSLGAINSSQDWDSDNSTSEKQKSDASKGNSHFISFDKENGAVQTAIYVNFYLILIQEFVVSLWNQTALGNVLGAQNLWIFNGCIKKLILNKECIRKKSLEMVISTEACVAYIELWTKEHKSDIRQGPVADVFATVYFWIQKLNRMDRKVLQLENINGFADDVQYVVLKPSLNIVVSWHSVVENSKMTQIRVYTLASDFQTIINARAMAKIEHYVSSLHNIEDCEELLMGCGDHKITLWNIEHGYIVATIELSDIKLSLSTLWVKCDRGILFTVQQCVDRELRLIAINGRSHSWKRLKSYKPPEGFERIQNVYIENGVLISFYEEGILCWKAQAGEQIVEEIHNETDVEYFPSGKYLIMITKKNVFIRHALTHLLTVDD